MNEQIKDTGTDHLLVESSRTILIIDDEALIRKMLSQSVEELGYRTLTADNGADGLALFSKEKPDLVFLDLRMPGQHGIDVLTEIRARDNDIPVVVISGQGTTHDVVSALKLGAWDFLLKPIDLKVLEYEISGWFDKSRLIQENRARLLETSEANHRLRKAIKDADSARQSAEQANVSKNEFVATMSNELRIPAMGIESMVDILLETQLDHEQRYIARVIQSSIASLNESLGRLMDYARMDSRKLILEKVNFSLDAVLGDVLFRMRNHLENPEVSFHRKKDSDVPDYLIGDPWRVSQLLCIFLDNAFRYTRQGSVELHISRQGGEPGVAMVRFEVSDTGRGMNPEILSGLFENGSSEKTQISRSSGAGLGLILARRLTSLMGGKIGVHSNVRKGSVFWFTLPIAVQPEDMTCDDTDIGRAYASITKIPPKHLNILVADANEDARIITGAFLRRIGCSFQMASSSVDVLEMLEENDYDLLLLDIQMPDMNGYDIAGVIRSTVSAVRNHDIPIIAIVEGSSTEAARTCRQRHIQKCIPRPFTFQHLVNAMEGLPLRNSD